MNVVEDLMDEFFGQNSRSALKLCIHDSHHNNITVIITVQNSFIEGNTDKNTTMEKQYYEMCFHTSRKTFKKPIPPVWIQGLFL